ncbi:MAG: hypothetical protein WBK95_02920, partial [Sulfurimonas sp.]|nr:hypothetical protein [Sulfurimonas sp.]MDD5203384.1 hypothetical protein [Sulfurimonas sp.]
LIFYTHQPFKLGWFQFLQSLIFFHTSLKQLLNRFGGYARSLISTDNTKHNQQWCLEMSKADSIFF